MRKKENGTHTRPSTPKRERASERAREDGKSENFIEIVRIQSKPIGLAIFCRTIARARDIAHPINYVSIMEKGFSVPHAKSSPSIILNWTIYMPCHRRRFRLTTKAYESEIQRQMRVVPETERGHPCVRIEMGEIVVVVVVVAYE